MPMVYRVRRGVRVVWMKIQCFGGPLNGETIKLDKWGDAATLAISLRGQSGQYRSGKWVAL